MVDSEKITIKYMADGETFSVTLQEIIKNLGFEYGLQANVFALLRDNLEIITIEIN